MLNNQVGPPVRGDDFFGREGIVNLISTKLRTTNILLAAPRRFGKTSVMYRLMDAPQWEYKIVHADVEHVCDPADLLIKLVEQFARDSALSKILDTVTWIPKQGFGLFKKHIQEIELVKVKIKMKDEIATKWQAHGDELFKKIADSPTPVIFFLDEFPVMIDRMARMNDAKRQEVITLLRWFRALRQAPGQTKVRFVIAGSIGIDRVLNELGEIASINDLEKIKLDPFPKQVAEAFLDKLSQQANLPFSSPCKRRILQVIGEGVPYFIQILFSEIVKAQAQSPTQLTPGLIEKIYRDKVLGVDCKSYFDHYFGRLHGYYLPHQEKALKRILRELAVVSDLTQDAAYQLYKGEVSQPSHEEFSRLMTDLENDFYVGFDSRGRKYSFACKVLRDWWLRHYGMSITI